VITRFQDVECPKRPVNPAFHKLPRNYAVDVVGSRILFKKKTRILVPVESNSAWNIVVPMNAYL
jgi:hypothetical protein